MTENTTAKYPLLSVIIPVYNVERYLPQCLDSVVGQTYPNLEILLIDDHSTDLSGQICDDYAARHPLQIRVLHHSENRGQSAARNLGIKEAKGEYIGFVDSDDWIDADYYLYLYKQMQEAQAEIAIAPILEERADGPRPIYTIPKTLIMNDREAVEANMKNRYMSGSLCDKLYTRHVIGDNLMSEGHFFEDMDITYKYLHRSPRTIWLGYKPNSTQPAYHYILSEGSTLRSGYNPKIEHDALLMFDKRAAWAKEVYNVPVNHELIIRKCVHLLNHLSLANEATPQTDFFRQDALRRLHEHSADKTVRLSASLRLKRWAIWKHYHTYVMCYHFVAKLRGKM